MIIICNCELLLVGNSAHSTFFGIAMFLTPSFLEREELRLFCRDEQTAEISWHSYVKTGARFLKAGEADAAFLELGNGLHIAHRQLQTSKTPSWRWAMRLVESTNMLVVALNSLGYNELVGPLLENVRGQINSLPALHKCPRGKDAAWLCRWCESMACPRRQAQIARMYEKSNKMESVPIVH